MVDEVQDAGAAAPAPVQDASSGAEAVVSAPVVSEQVTNPVEGVVENNNVGGRGDLFDKISKAPEENKEFTFNPETAEARESYINSLPQITNTEMYNDIGVTNEMFSDIGDVLAQAKVLPEQIKPIIEYYDKKVVDLQSKAMSEEDYAAKSKKYMGEDYDVYHPKTDEMLVKYVPKELANSIINAPNDVIVAFKTAMANTIKEYDQMFDKIKNDYGVDPSDYKLNSLNNRSAVDNNSYISDLVKKGFDLKQAGDVEGVEKTASDLRRAMGFK